MSVTCSTVLRPGQLCRHAGEPREPGGEQVRVASGDAALGQVLGHTDDTDDNSVADKRRVGDAHGPAAVSAADGEVTEPRLAGQDGGHDVGPVFPVVRCDQQLSDVGAEHLVAAVSVEALSRCVPVEDAALEIGRDHGGGDGVQQAGRRTATRSGQRGGLFRRRSCDPPCARHSPG